MKYHFSSGDSLPGPVGIAGVVEADSSDAAEAILKEHLPEEVSLRKICGFPDEIEYVNIYLNPDYDWGKDIDEETAE